MLSYVRFWFSYTSLMWLGWLIGCELKCWCDLVRGLCARSHVHLLYPALGSGRLSHKNGIRLAFLPFGLWSEGSMGGRKRVRQSVCFCGCLPARGPRGDKALLGVPSMQPSLSLIPWNTPSAYPLRDTEVMVPRCHHPGLQQSSSQLPCSLLINRN